MFERERDRPSMQDKLEPECLSCRIIGTATLAIVGLYALRQSRARAPGSVLGKRIVGGLGVCTCSLLFLRFK
jgi:hypothetical protein